MATDYFIGLMSGTSLDAIDAVLVDFSGDLPNLRYSINHPLPQALRADIQDLCSPGDNEIERLGQADILLGKAFANAANDLLKSANVSNTDVIAIGSHGQTIRHLPEIGFTLQIGDPNIIAEHTGITTVADLRRRDMAAGGQGAPLVSAFHAAVFSNEQHSDEQQARVILNIGGMANVTLLIPGQPVSGFDTGPGNILMDAWIQHHQQQTFDRNGAWAASGAVDDALLANMLQDDFFQQPPPKSTGRERFNLDWLNQHLNVSEPSLAAEDIQATLCELTAASIANAVTNFAPAGSGIIVCGGGARNSYLMERLAKRLSGNALKTSDESGIAAEWVEATAFAWLARETLAHRPGNVPTVTGAARPVVLGGIYPAGETRR
jgi:anhydro-N-acetylmuramic acid kinase